MAEINEDQVIQDKVNIAMTLLRELCKQESFKFGESKEQTKLIMTNIINDMLAKYTGSEEFKATSVNVKSDGKVELELQVPEWLANKLNANDEE